MTRYVLPILLSACGLASQKAPVCEAVPLGIDNLFSGSERRDIIKAISNWEAASGNRICFQILWRDTANDKRSFKSDNRFTIYSQRRPWQVRSATTVGKNSCPRKSSCLGLTVWNDGGRASDIFVLAAKPPILRATIEHELGHMFGLGHSQTYESIMYPTINKDKQIGVTDRRILGCLLETRTFLRSRNRCSEQVKP